jgi:hypothetical protein
MIDRLDLFASLSFSPVDFLVMQPDDAREKWSVFNRFSSFAFPTATKTCHTLPVEHRNSFLPKFIHFFETI